jgi:acyl-CoA thioesterase
MVSEKIRQHLLTDKFAAALGIELIALEEGYARCEMVVRKDMLNAHGSTHGGAIFTLADFAFASACNSYGQTAVALEVNINFLEAVKPGTRLIAEAKEESKGGRIALYHLTVIDEHGKLVASSHATAYRKNEWFHK